MKIACILWTFESSRISDLRVCVVDFSAEAGELGLEFEVLED